MGGNYVQEREAICRNPPDTLGRKRLAGSRCHSQVVTKAMHGGKGHAWWQRPCMVSKAIAGTGK